MDYFIGLDCGGTFMKACLFDEAGKEVALARTNATVLNEQAGWVERDLDHLWNDACVVLKQVLAESGIAPASVKGLSISAQGKGVYLLDKNGNNLRHGIVSSDSRSLDIVKQWQQQGLPKQIYPLTLQTLWTGHPVSIVRWLKEHEPHNYANIGAIMMAHDYLRYRLTGNIHAEITNISESNFFNAKTGTYDKGLLELFGIPEVFDALPEIIGPDQLAGQVSKQVAEQTGLLADTPVYGGLFDVVSTAICSGIDAEGTQLNAVMGTWSVTSGITNDVTFSNSHNFVYGHYAVAGQYIIHEASPTSASNYEWFAPYLGEQGKLNHPANEALVKALEPAASELFFVPFLYGSNAGLGIKSGFYGMQAHHKPGHLIQAIWEGVLFCHYVHLQRMRERFPKAKVLRVTGGTTGSQTWMQMLADMTGMTVEIPQIEETGSLGAAIMAMVGSGRYASIEQALQGLDIPCRCIQPNPAHYPAYQRKYQRYLKLVELFKAFEEEVND